MSNTPSKELLKQEYGDGYEAAWKRADAVGKQMLEQEYQRGAKEMLTWTYPFGDKKVLEDLWQRFESDKQGHEDGR